MGVTRREFIKTTAAAAAAASIGTAILPGGVKPLFKLGEYLYISFYV